MYGPYIWPSRVRLKTLLPLRNIYVIGHVVGERCAPKSRELYTDNVD